MIKKSTPPPKKTPKKPPPTTTTKKKTQYKKLKKKLKSQTQTKHTHKKTNKSPPKNQNSAIKITTTCSSVWKALTKGVLLHNNPSSTLKTEKSGCKFGLGTAWTWPLLCCLLYNSHLYPNNSFLWGREQKKKSFGIFWLFSNAKNCVSSPECFWSTCLCHILAVRAQRQKE